MTSAELLLDAYGRVTELVHRALKDVAPETLAFRADPDANSLAWLVWHLTRVQDSHLAEVQGREQIWLDEGWHGRSGLPFDAPATGYAQTSTEVATVAALSADFLLGYHDAVIARSRVYLATLSDADLDRIVDTNWDPPVTLGVRLVSVLSDNLQHAGQAAFSRGIAERLSA